MLRESLLLGNVSDVDASDNFLAALSMAIVLARSS